VNPIASAFLAVAAFGIVVLPRRLAPLPLIAGACYITRAQGLDLGPFSFTVVRVLVFVGVVRVIVRREWLAGGLKSIDALMLLWGTWMVVSGLFHADAVVNRLGLTFDGWGLYFLFRVFCRSTQELLSLSRLTAMLLMPIAAEMLVEQATGHNLFSVLGGVPQHPVVRDGRIRAQGPFAHSILAGTIGAVILPLMIGMWRIHRRSAIMGTLACIAMVYASSSSGPIMSALAGLAALSLWRYRHRMYLLRWGAVVCYIALMMVMEDAPYFLMARIDLAGGSTGWHRARLIESAFQHLSEWWLTGTDYTRHWLATGVAWSPNHTDITNHYIHMGVLGGLPLMVVFILVLGKGFSAVGRTLRQRAMPPSSEFLLWACGASLFAHTATCIGVAYFDQSIVFLYLSLAATVGASYAGPIGAETKAVATPPNHFVETKSSTTRPRPRLRGQPAGVLLHARSSPFLVLKARQGREGTSEPRRS
jgi:hypothetical protein